MVSKNPLQSLHDFILRVLAFLEKDRFNVLTGFLLFTLIVCIRFFFEFTFFSKYPNYVYVGSLYNVYHQFAFYVFVFLFGVFILSLFSTERPKKIINMVLITFPLIFIAPLIDKFIMNRTEPYIYAHPENYVGNLFNLFIGSEATLGLQIQGWAIMLLGAFYVSIKMMGNNNLDSFKRILVKCLLPSIGALFSLYFMMTFVGTFPVLIYTSLFDTGYFTSFSLQLIDFLWLFVFGVILALVFVYISKPKVVRIFLGSLRLSYLIYFMLLAGIGILVAGIPIYKQNINEGLFGVNDMSYGITCLFAIVFGWLFTNRIRDVYPRERIKAERSLAGMLTKSQHIHTTILLAIITFGLGVLLGLISAILILICLILGWVYALLRLRIKNSILSSLFFGLGSSLSYFIGFFSTNQTKDIVILGYKFVVPITTALPNNVAFLIALFIFFIGFGISIVTKLQRD
jgi:hypothetical protein